MRQVAEVRAAPIFVLILHQLSRSCSAEHELMVIIGQLLRGAPLARERQGDVIRSQNTVMSFSIVTYARMNETVQNNIVCGHKP